MIQYEIGDIVLITEYVYKDNNEIGDCRPFVIIGEERFVDVVDYYGLLVSSQRDKGNDRSHFKYNEPLDRELNNGLDYDSIVKCDSVYDIKKENIVHKLGSVAPADFLRFMDALKDFEKNG